MKIRGFCIDCGEPLTKSEVNICFMCSLDRVREREAAEHKRNYKL